MHTGKHNGSISLELDMVSGVLLEPYMSQGPVCCRDTYFMERVYPMNEKENLPNDWHKFLVLHTWWFFVPYHYDVHNVRDIERLTHFSEHCGQAP